MSELIVAGYASAERAEGARDDLLRMASAYLVDVADAVVGTADDKGDIRLSQMVNLWTAGAGGPGLWGLLIGLLFLDPLAGVLTGGAAGALSRARSDYGIGDSFMTRVSAILAPGRAALFVMPRRAASDPVIAALAVHGGEIVRATLDPAREDRVHAALARAHAEAALQRSGTPSGAMEAGG